MSEPERHAQPQKLLLASLQYSIHKFCSRWHSLLGLPRNLRAALNRRKPQGPQYSLAVKDESLWAITYKFIFMHTANSTFVCTHMVLQPLRYILNIHFTYCKEAQFLWFNGVAPLKIFQQASGCCETSCALHAVIGSFFCRFYLFLVSTLKKKECFNNLYVTNKTKSLQALSVNRQQTF